MHGFEVTLLMFMQIWLMVDYKVKNVEISWVLLLCLVTEGKTKWHVAKNLLCRCSILQLLPPPLEVNYYQFDFGSACDTISTLCYECEKVLITMPWSTLCVLGILTFRIFYLTTIIPNYHHFYPKCASKSIIEVKQFNTLPVTSSSLVSFHLLLSPFLLFLLLYFFQPNHVL